MAEWKIYVRQEIEAAIRNVGQLCLADRENQYYIMDADGVEALCHKLKYPCDEMKVRDLT